MNRINSNRVGRTGGIGHEIVKKLSDNGFAIAVHYSSNKLKADTIVNEIIKKGGKAISIGGDVADEKGMQEAFEIVEERLVVYCPYSVFKRV